MTMVGMFMVHAEFSLLSQCIIVSNRIKIECKGTDSLM